VRGTTESRGRHRNLFQCGAQLLAISAAFDEHGGNVVGQNAVELLSQDALRNTTKAAAAAAKKGPSRSMVSYLLKGLLNLMSHSNAAM
jgi:hypothetical protein